MANYANSKQIQDLLKLSPYEFKKFVRDGMPKEGSNKFNLVACVHWYIDYLKDKTDFGSVSEIATLIGRTERYVSKLAAEKNLPGKVAHGKYNKIAFINAYIDYKDKQIKEAKAGGENRTDAQARLVRANADFKEIELAEKQKQVVPVKPLMNTLLGIFLKFGKSIDTMPGKVINKIYACNSKSEMLDVLNKATRQLKEHLSKEELELFLEEDGH